MTAFQFTNFAEGHLTAPLGAGDSFVQISPTEAARMPIPLGEDVVFSAILQDGVQEPEIIWCKDNDLTGKINCWRGQEGTAAVSWAPGSLLSHVMTAGALGFVAGGGSTEWVTILDGKLKDNFALLESEITVVSDNLKSEVSIRELLSAKFGDALGTISTLTTSFADLNTAYVKFSTDATASLGSMTASIKTMSDAIVSEGIARADQDSLLLSMVGGNSTALIDAEATTRATADTALASTITKLDATVKSNFTTLDASITNEATTRASADSALAATTTALDATVKSNFTTLDASVKSEASARATADSAISATVTALTATEAGDYGNLSASITTEATTRATKDSSLSTLITNLTALEASDIGNVTALVTTEASARASADAAIVSTATALDATVKTNAATEASDIKTEQTARASGDATNASDITTLKSTLAGNVATLTSSIAAEATTRAAADSTNASDITTLKSTLAGNVATLTSSIASEATTRAAGDATNASDIVTVKSTAAGLAATVTTVQGTVATIDKNLSGYYGVQVDANGAIASMVLFAGSSGNTTTTSGVVFDVDNFVIRSGKAAGVQPFVYDSGTGTLLLQNATLTGGININPGGTSGRMVLTNNKIDVYDTSNVLRTRMGQL